MSCMLRRNGKVKKRNTQKFGTCVSSSSAMVGGRPRNIFERHATSYEPTAFQFANAEEEERGGQRGS